MILQCFLFVFLLLFITKDIVATFSKIIIKQLNILIVEKNVLYKQTKQEYNFSVFNLKNKLYKCLYKCLYYIIRKYNTVKIVFLFWNGVRASLFNAKMNRSRPVELSVYLELTQKWHLENGIYFFDFIFSIYYTMWRIRIICFIW